MKEEQKLQEVEFLSAYNGKEKLIINPKLIGAVLLTSNYNQNDYKKITIYIKDSYQPLDLNCDTSKEAEEVFEKLRLVTKLI